MPPFRLLSGSAPSIQAHPMTRRLLALILAWPVTGLMAQASPQPDFSKVKETIQQWVNKHYYTGASLWVAQDGNLLCEAYFGDAKPDTVVYIASAGKWLAAAAIAAVVDEGKLAWDDPASKWIPELGGTKGRATLRQLLSHTAGYPAYQPADQPTDNYQTLSESVARLLPLPSDHRPGERFVYGGLAMQVAGRMAELATGKDWESLFQEKIARPLEMKDTRFTPVDTQSGGHAPMLAGGARCTLRDYANFLEMIARDGEFHGHRVLSKEAVREMQADQVHGARVETAAEFVARARGAQHAAIYGLGEWREELDKNGQALLISSPSWAGTYPWIDKTTGVQGILLAHVDAHGPATRDKFNSFYASPVLPMLVREALEAKRDK